jgi:hypothetical protein
LVPTYGMIVSVVLRLTILDYRLGCEITRMGISKSGVGEVAADGGRLYVRTLLLNGCDGLDDLAHWGLPLHVTILT